MTDNPTMRAAALKLMSNGQATMAEIAELTGLSRQAIRFWATKAGVDPVETRQRRLLVMWNQSLIPRRRQ